MRISIIATVMTTNLIARINRGFVVAGEQMVSVLRSSSHHLSACPAKPKLPLKPDAKAQQDMWQATGAVLTERYQRSSSRRLSTGTTPCPSGTF
jgi:hypothetical protein